jgi:hypothetical protein
MQLHVQRHIANNQLYGYRHTSAHSAYPNTFNFKWVLVWGKGIGTCTPSFFRQRNLSIVAPENPSTASSPLRFECSAPLTEPPALRNKTFRVWGKNCRGEAPRPYFAIAPFSKKAIPSDCVPGFWLLTAHWIRDIRFQKSLIRRKLGSNLVSAIVR